MKPKIKVYIAGPMRGLPNNNHGAFNRWAGTLRGQGFDVVNPVEVGSRFGTVAQIESNPALLESVMQAELHEVGTCDTIFLLDGWETSVGAKRELCAALNLGLSVVLEPKVSRRYAKEVA